MMRSDAWNFIDDLRRLQQDFADIVDAKCTESLSAQEMRCPYIDQAIAALVKGYGERPNQVLPPPTAVVTAPASVTPRHAGASEILTNVIASLKQIKGQLNARSHV